MPQRVGDGAEHARGRLEKSSFALEPLEERIDEHGRIVRLNVAVRPPQSQGEARRVLPLDPVSPQQLHGVLAAAPHRLEAPQIGHCPLREERLGPLGVDVEGHEQGEYIVAWRETLGMVHEPSVHDQLRRAAVVAEKAFAFNVDRVLSGELPCRDGLHVIPDVLSGSLCGTDQNPSFHHRPLISLTTTFQETARRTPLRVRHDPRP